MEVSKKGSNALSAVVAPGKDRFNNRYEAAVLANDGEEIDRLERLRSDLTAFINAYDLLSQVINYEDTSAEKHAISYHALARVIREESRRSPIDLAGLALLDPMPRTWSKKAVDPVLARLLEAVNQ